MAMRRVIPALLSSAAVAILVTAIPPPAGACACGVAMQSRIDAERALIVVRPGAEDLVVSYDLRAKGKHPAVVIPVPSQPRVRAVEGEDPLTYLDRVTAPPVVQNDDSDGASGGAPAGSVVVRRSFVGGFAVARLRGTDSRAIDRWLHRNGYGLPAGAEPMIDSYVRRNWWFVALRLDRKRSGPLKPLKITFATDAPVYPMRLAQLGKVAVELDLYVVAPREVTAAPLTTAYTGAVADLPSPPESVRRLLAGGGTLTKLVASGVAPGVFTKDLYPEPVGAAGTSSAQVVPAVVPTGGEDRRLPFGWIAAGVGVFLGGAGIAMARARRSVRSGLGHPGTQR